MSNKDLRITKKTHKISDFLNHYQYKQFKFLLESFSQYQRGITFRLGDSWRLIINENSQVELYPKIFPSANGILSLNKTKFPSIWKIQKEVNIKYPIEGVEEHIVGIQKFQDIAEKIGKYICSHTHQSSYYGKEEICINLGPLGQIKLIDFLMTYNFPSKGCMQEKWTVENKVTHNYLINRRNSTNSLIDSGIKQKQNHGTMGKKFSLHSFSSHLSAQKQSVGAEQIEKKAQQPFWKLNNPTSQLPKVNRILKMKQQKSMRINRCHSTQQFKAVKMEQNQKVKTQVTEYGCGKSANFLQKQQYNEKLRSSSCGNINSKKISYKIPIHKKNNAKAISTKKLHQNNKNNGKKQNNLLKLHLNRQMRPCSSKLRNRQLQIEELNIQKFKKVLKTIVANGTCQKQYTSQEINMYASNFQQEMLHIMEEKFNIKNSKKNIFNKKMPLHCQKVINKDINNEKFNNKALQKLLRRKKMINTFQLQLVQEIDSLLQQQLKALRFIRDFRSQKIINSLQKFRQVYEEHKIKIEKYAKNQYALIEDSSEKQKNIQQKFNLYKYEKKMVKKGRENGKLVIERGPTKKQINLIEKYCEKELQETFCPYFYLFSCSFRNLTQHIVKNIQKCEPVCIVVEQGMDYLKTIDQYVDKVTKVKEIILQFSSFFPQKIFRISQSEIEILSKVFLEHQQRIKGYVENWRSAKDTEYKYCQSKFTRLCEELEQLTSKNEDNSVELKLNKNIGNIANKYSHRIDERQKIVKMFDTLIDRIINSKRHLSVEQNILDVNSMVNQLVKQVENKIIKIYDESYQEMNILNHQWYQEITRSQRLLPEELLDEEIQINNKLSEFFNLFKKNLKIYIFNRQRFFIIDRKNPKNAQMLNIQEHIRTLYTMKLKNAHKMQQIRFSVKNYRQKITIFSKSLEKYDKQIKNEFKQMVKQMKNLIKDIRNRAEIINNEQKITLMHKKFRNYTERKESLHKEMCKYYMIVWEDDDYLQRNFSILLKVIKFMDSETYRKINYQSIDYIRFQHFHRYQIGLQKLMNSLKKHKFQEFFVSDCVLEQQQLKFIQMCLYKDYYPEEINELYKMKIDLRPGQSTTKIIDLIKMIKNDQNFYGVIEKIYAIRKMEKYKKILKNKFSINLEVAELPFGVKKILNYHEIVMILNQENEGQNNHDKKEQLGLLLKTQQFFQAIYDHEIMIQQIGKQIGQKDLKKLQQFLQKHYLLYNLVIGIWNTNKGFYFKQQSQENGKKIAKRQSQNWQALVKSHFQLQSFGVKEIFYRTVSQICSRLMCVEYRKLIQLMDWSNNTVIIENCKILFPEVIDVSLDKNMAICSMQVRRGKYKDKIILFNKSLPPLDRAAGKKVSGYIRQLEKQVQKSLFEKVRNSNGRSGQIKILNCLLYFTQQVQIHMITKNPLSSLQKSLKSRITEIMEDLRYDICDHKQEEICQLNTFINYIEDFLGFFPDPEGFDWKNTIKAYEKDYSVVIIQNQMQFYYGFEPKQIQCVTIMNWNLTLASILYGSQNKIGLYKLKSYIVGVPYFEIHGIQNTYLNFAKNFTSFLSAIQFNQFIVTLFYDGMNKKLFNQFHSQIILQILKNREKISLAETDMQKVSTKPMLRQKLSLLICYRDYQKVPECLARYYGCVSQNSINVENLPLRIHLLISSHPQLSSQSKGQIISQFIKLAEVISCLENIQIDSMMKLLTEILDQIKGCKGVVNDTMKMNIYKKVVQKGVKNVQNMRQIIHKIFSTRQIYQEKNKLQKDKEKVLMANKIFLSSLVSNDEVEGTNDVKSKNMKKLQKIQPPFIFSSTTRSELYFRLKTFFNDLIEDKNIKKPIIIYGEEITCKTSFIKNQLVDKLPSNSLIKTGEITMFTTNQLFQNVKIIEGNTLSQISPQIITNCCLVYVPGIQETSQYYVEIKNYFCQELLSKLSSNKNLCPFLISELQNIFNNLLDIIKIVNNHQHQNPIKLTIILELVIKVICSVFKKLEEQSGQKNYHLLVFLILWEILAANSTHKKEIINEIKKSFQKKLNEWKIDNFEVLTFTSKGEIIKIENPSMSKWKNLSTVANYERQLAKKYLDLKQNIIVSGDNYLCRQIGKQLQTLLTQSRKNYTFSLKINHFSQIVKKMQKVYEKKSHRKALSTNLISGKIIQMLSYMVIEEKNINDEIAGYIFVDDLHLSTPIQFAQLAANLEISEKFSSENNYLKEYGYIILYKNGYILQKHRKLAKNAVHISLPELSLTNIFRFRSHQVITQDQTKIVEEIYNSKIFPLSDIATYSQFVINTSLRLPTQFYYKFFFNTTIILYFSAINQFCNRDRPILSTITQIQNQLKSRSKDSSLIDRLIGAKSHFIKNHKNSEPGEIQMSEATSIFSQFVNNLPIAQRLICEKYFQILPLFMFQKLYIVSHDRCQLLTRSTAKISKRKIIKLGSNFRKGISSVIEQMIKDSQLKVIFLIPEFLLSEKRVVRFLIDYMDENQLLYQYQQLFDRWWASVAEKEYIQNSVDQDKIVKEMMERILRERINFFISCDEINAKEVSEILTRKEEYQDIDNEIGNKQLQEKMRRRKQKIVLVNGRLSLEQQLQIIHKICDHYQRNKKMLSNSKQFVDLIKQSLIFIVRQLNQQQKEAGQNIYQNSNIFIDILNNVPILYEIISQILMESEKSNNQKQNQNSLKHIISSNKNMQQIITNIRHKIDQSQEFINEYAVCEKSYLQNYSQIQTYFDEIQQQNKQENQKIIKQIENKSLLQKKQFRKSKIMSYYISEEFTKIKSQFISRSDTNVYQNNNQNVIMPQISQARVVSKLINQFLSTKSSNKNGKICKQVGPFIIIINISVDIGEIFVKKTEYEMQKFMEDLKKFKEIPNLQSIIAGIKYGHRISNFFLNNSTISENVIQKEFQTIKYINLLDTLSICKIFAGSLRQSKYKIEENKRLLQKAFKFAISISNFQESNNKAGFSITNDDMRIRYRLYQTLNDNILGKLSKNMKINFHLHQLFKLDANIQNFVKINEYSLMYNYQQEKILNHFQKLGEFQKIFSQSKRNNQTKKTLVNIQQGDQMESDYMSFKNLERAHTEQQMKVGWDQSQKKLSYSDYKYSVFLDPLLLIPSTLQKMNRVSQIKHYKHVYVKAEDINDPEAMQKIFKVNYWVTYYIFLFQEGNQAQLADLIKFLKERERRGKGLHDRLLVMVIESKLINKVQFILQGLDKKYPLLKGYAKFTQIDMLQFFHQHQKFHKQNRQNLKSIHQCGKNIHHSPQIALQQMVNEFIIYKSYLKVMLGEIVDNIDIEEARVIQPRVNVQNEDIFQGNIKVENNDSGNQSLNQMCRKMDEYNSIKNRLIDLYKENKTIDYGFFLQSTVTTAISDIFASIIQLLQAHLITMDFVKNIGCFISLKSLIKEVERQKNPKQIIQHIFRKKYQTNKFDSQPRMITRATITMEKHQQKTTSLKGNTLNINSLKEILDSSGIILIFYCELPNLILKSLLPLRSTLDIIYDEETDPNVLRSIIVNLNFSQVKATNKIDPKKSEKQKKSIIFANKSWQKNYRSIFHLVKIIWIQ